MTLIRGTIGLIRRGHVLPPIAFISSPNSNKNEITNSININKQLCRHYSKFEITKNLEIISNDKINSKISNLQLSNPPNKPMVILLPWLLAKRKHILKYASFYLDQGFDVLNVECSPWQVLWPLKGVKLVADDILTFLEKNPLCKPLVLHGFSVGGYLWSEVMVKALSDQARYQPIFDRIIGQVWDSAVDVAEITIGLPKAVFPNNQMMQRALKQYMMYHLKTFDQVATTHYLRASQIFHTNPLIRTPALFYVSKTDPIGSLKANEAARENWESLGIKVNFKCFEKSSHVGHYRKYPKEYMAELYSFINELGLVQYPEKVKVQL
ncbi:transmembrane protein 53-B-like [Chrysoperla carnea]|uniref:transmembrane protein 53-B-like n=1 Tax=Chrysoperla carnea TaxID=189513 RepID=UPI001D05E8DE|nr:transmembrane protein 53-B-like [Chrysoperla carnea]